MLSESLAKELSNQFNKEMYSAYLYLSMSSYAEGEGLKGAAKWLYVQSQEEMAHAMHTYQYILDRGAQPEFTAIEAPTASFQSLTHVFEMVLAHEIAVTKRLNDVATLAMKENDHACYQFMLWYVNEQVEEEANIKDILSKLKLIGDNKGLLLGLDSNLAGRAFINPFLDDAKMQGGGAVIF